MNVLDDLNLQITLNLGVLIYLKFKFHAQLSLALKMFYKVKTSYTPDIPEDHQHSVSTIKDSPSRQSDIVSIYTNL